MSRMQHDVKVGTAKVVNPILLTLPFLGIWFFYYAERTVSPFYYWGNWVVVALFFILYILFCRIYDGFLISINRISEIVYSQALASVTPWLSRCFCQDCGRIMLIAGISPSSLQKEQP